MFNKPTFGANTPGTSFGFGSTNANNTGPFGSSNLFAKPNTTGFGQQQSTFGQPSSSIFPNTQNAGASMFPSTGTSGFGSQSTPQTSFGSGLFGQQQQQQPAANNIFGSSTFGQQNKPFGFSSQPTSQTNLFGQPSQPQQSLFQSAGSSNIFGGSTFGSNTTMGVTGTGAVKFNPVTGTDTMQKSGVSTTINTKHHCITCMKEYDSKSLEELRFEDYQANRKGPAAAAPFGASPFGGTQPSVPLFGQTDNKPAFGTGTGFGQQPMGGFGTSAPTFGTQNTANRGVFGNQTPGFGAIGPTNSGFGAFGSTTSNASAFSSAQNKPFGTTTTTMFGNTQNQPQATPFGSNFFGQTSQASTGSFFGKPAQSTFGTGSTFSFGQTQTPATQNTTNMFQSKPVFGLTQTSSTPFGQTTQTGFGASTFNKPVTFNQPQSTFNVGGQSNMFSMNQPKPTFFGGTTTGSSPFGSTFQSTSLFPSSQPLTQQQPDLFNQQNNNENKDVSLLSTNQFGRSSYLSGLLPLDKMPQNPPLYATNPDEIKKILSPSNQVERSVSKKPQLKMGAFKNETSALFDVEDDLESIQKYHSLSAKKLVIKNKPDIKETYDPDYKLLLTSPSNTITSPNKENYKPSTSELGTPLRKNLRDNRTLKHSSLSGDGDGILPAGIISSTIDPGSGGDTIHNRFNTIAEHDADREDPPTFDCGAGDADRKLNRCGVTLTRAEYYTLPSLEELDNLVSEGKCIVKGFTIGRKGYGNVYFPDEMNVANLNLDEIIHFRYRELVVYPDDNLKPPLGEGLNRPAQVTLDRIYPRVKQTKEIIDDPDQIMASGFPEQLIKTSAKRGIKFIDYRPETGSWVFQVNHFSKYGFTESDDEECELSVLKKELKSTEKLISKFDKPKIPLSQTRMLTDNEDVNSMCTDEGDQRERDVLHKSMGIDLIEAEDSSMTDYSPRDDLFYDPSNQVQLMKATFFSEVDQDEESISSSESHMSFEKKELFDSTKVQVNTRNPPVRPKVRTVFALKEYQPDYSHIRSLRCYCDFGVFKVNSFKVGWSRGFQHYDFYSGRNMKRGLHQITLKQSHTSVIFYDSIKKAIGAAVEFSVIENMAELESEQLPIFTMANGRKYLLELNRIFENALSRSSGDEEKLYNDVITLCYSLWGPGRKTNPFVKARVSEWLKKSIEKEVVINSRELKYESLSTKLSTIFNLLTCYNIEEAAKVAMDCNFINLSMIISQVILSSKPRWMMEQQLETWYKNFITDHISQDLLKIYLLLAGISFKDSVNVCYGLDWKRALGIHLWYIVPAAAQMHSVIQSYTDGFETLGYAKSPNLSYDEDKTDVYHILYHILLLYQNGSHRLSKVLSPFTYSSILTDYRLSWLLMLLFKYLNVGSIDKCEEDHIHTNFSSQLEELGLWSDAIFPLLFLKNGPLKTSLVTKLLERNLSIDSNEETKIIEEKLVKQYHIPASLIHRLKAEKCYLHKKYWLAYSHYLHAKEWDKSNRIFVEHLLCKLFLQSEEDLILTLIEKFIPGKDFINNWDNELGLIYDIYQIERRFKVARGNSELLQLQREMIEVCHKLKKFPLFSVHHKLCLADLSKRCMVMYQGLAAQMENICLKPSLEDLFEWFVMPPDYVSLAKNGYVIQKF